jgi:hypothetical protein
MIAGVLMQYVVLRERWWLVLHGSSTASKSCCARLISLVGPGVSTRGAAARLVDMSVLMLVTLHTRQCASSAQSVTLCNSAVQR